MRIVRQGRSVATLGDIDGDGISDIAVGAAGDSTGSPYDDARGAVYILYLNWDGTAKRCAKIANNTGGGPPLEEDDLFGAEVSLLGDLDGDGTPEIAVGAIYDDTGGSGRGAVYVLFLNSDGTIKRYEKIAHETNGGPLLSNYVNFGLSIAPLGDLNGDGTPDFVVGSDGAVHVLFLRSEVFAGDYNADGTVDAADYTAWRDKLGTTVPAYSNPDGSGNGLVDQADYEVWKENFGKVQPEEPMGSGASMAIAESEPAIETPQVTTETGNTSSAPNTPDIQTIRESLPLSASVVFVDRPRFKEPRLPRRTSPTVFASHDSALAALTALRKTAGRQRLTAADADDIWRNSTDDSPIDRCINAFDLALESLEVHAVPTRGAQLAGSR